MRSSHLLFPVCLALGLFASTTYGAFDLDTEFGTDNSTIAHCGGGTAQGGIVVGDVKINGTPANDCWGVYNGNDPGPGGQLETGGMFFDFLTKYEKEGDVTEGADIGLSYDTSDGSFTYTGPIGNDFMVVLKQGSNPGWGTWLFTDEDATVSPAGSYWVAWQGNGKDLSHMSIYAKSTNGGGPSIPEPGTLALLSIAALGLGIGRRRRR